LDLFLELGADDDQCDFPYLFASGLEGYAKEDLDADGVDMQPLFEAILRHVPPVGDAGHCSYKLPPWIIPNIWDCDWQNSQRHYPHGSTSRLGYRNWDDRQSKISKLMGFEGLKRIDMDSASAGNIVAVAGFADANIGETITCLRKPQALPLLKWMNRRCR